MMDIKKNALDFSNTEIAFSNKSDALKFQQGKQGVIMNWKEVYNKIK